MAKPKTDKLQCRHCRLREPAITIRRVKGLPYGECIDCNRKQQLQTRLKRNFHLGLYSATPELVAANTKTLPTLHPGAYALKLNTTKAQVGYIIVLNGSVFVNAWNQTDLYRYQMFDIASVLGNQNLYIDPKPIQLSESDPKGLGMAVKPASEAMVWLDQALMDKAVKLVSAQLAEIKRANMAIARSNNPMLKPDAKPAE